METKNQVTRLTTRSSTFSPCANMYRKLLRRLPAETLEKVIARWMHGLVPDPQPDARVVVDLDSGKFASAHDLRRAFGFRWASRVMPAVLKELMRHTDISTTMKYYVGQNADQTADVIWEAFELKNGRNVGTSVGSDRKTDEKSLAK